MQLSAKSHLSCTACPLAEKRTQVVIPDCGDTFNGLLAIGEAPGADEDAQGVGFIGKAGRTLDALLHDHGIARDQYARANMCCCRPPDNRKPKKPELAACEPWLAWWVTEKIPTQVILAVGGTPANYFYGVAKLSDAIDLAHERGFMPTVPWAKEAGIQVVPMPHVSPLAWNRNAPSGEKWSTVGARQVSKAVLLLG